MNNMEDTQKELHDDFCILMVFVVFLVIGMIVGGFYLTAKGYGSAVRQGLDSYNRISLK